MLLQILFKTQPLLGFLMGLSSKFLAPLKLKVNRAAKIVAVHGY